MAAYLVKLIKGTRVEFVSSNPRLSAGEIALETDTGQCKIGNGISRYNSLMYIGGDNAINLDYGLIASSAELVAKFAPISSAWLPNTVYKTGQMLHRSNHLYVVNTDHTSPGSFSTTNLTEIVGSGGTGDLIAANNLSDLANITTARTNLGLGTAATQSTGTFATAAQGTKADNALAAANNLSDVTNAGTARTNLGLGTAATQASTAFAAAAGPFTPSTTGANAVGQYKGVTATGAPSTGTWAVGDWITTRDGIRWTCTTGGTPGTWTQEPGTGSGGGGEIVQYPTGGPWPSRPATSGDVLWVTADPTAATPSGALVGDAVIYPQLESWMFALSDESTNITTGTAKLTVRWPYATRISSVRASLTTVSSSGVVTVDINEGGVSILSTKLTIDANEKSSTTAATPFVLSDNLIADDAEVTFDIDTAGTGAKGLKVIVYGWR